MSLAACLSFLLRYIIALIAIAFYTLIERKFLGYFQARKGPNKPVLIGLPVPFADAIKLFVKEQSKPSFANQLPFIMSPVFSLTLALLLWVLFPHLNQAFFLQFGVLYFLCVSSCTVYATFLSGWSSNSKYALLGALRGIAQTISYEVRMSLILIGALILLGSLDFTYISLTQWSWVAILVPALGAIWFITNLAETNRTPFDFAEGESELVSGFNVEYRRGLFALIFISEYTRIIAIRLITAATFSSLIFSSFLGNSFLILKTLIISITFIWIRATIPRIRYDSLIILTWKSFLPVTLGALIILTPVVLLLSWHCAGWTDNSDDVKYGSHPVPDWRASLSTCLLIRRKY